MLTKMTAFLARAPALQGLSLTVGDVGPAPYTAGLWCRGITVLDRRENLLGRVTQRCRAEFTLRLCLPRTDADNAARLLDLQTWAQRRAPQAAGRCWATRGTRSCAPSRAVWSALTRAARRSAPCVYKRNTHKFIRRKPHEN